MSSRRHAQVNAVVALLQALPEAWLEDVLARLNTRGVVVLETPAKRERRACGVCGHYYPKCRALAQATGDEHDFEAPASASPTSSTPEAGAGTTYDDEDYDR